MCLAVPVRVTALLPASWIEIDVSGTPGRVSSALIGPVAIGDYVIVRAGFAIARLDASEALSTLALFEEIAVHLREPLDAEQSPLDVT